MPKGSGDSTEHDMDIDCSVCMPSSSSSQCSWNHGRSLSDILACLGATGSKYFFGFWELEVLGIYTHH